MKYLTTILALALIGLIGNAQQHKETINKEIDFTNTSKSVLMVENIFGDIKVEGYNGNKVILEVEKEFSADTKNELEEALKKVFLAVDSSHDTVDIYLD